MKRGESRSFFFLLLAAAISYRESVKPLLDQHCVECHSHRAELNLAQFPFSGGSSPDQPTIVRRILTLVGGATPPMPPGNRPKLDPSEVSVIQGWLEGGLLP